MKCTNCDFVKLDGIYFCLLNIKEIEDIHKEHECEILNNYREYQKTLKE